MFFISKGSVVQASKQFKEKVKTIIDWQVVQFLDKGEQIKFKQFSNIFGLLIDQYRKTVGINIHIASDDTDFSINQVHITSGWILLDIDAKISGTDTKIFFNLTDEDGNKQMKDCHTKDN